MENTDTNTFAAIIVAAMIIVLAIFTSLILNLNLVENLIFGWALTTVYSVFALFITGDTIILPTRTEIKEILKEVEKPVYVDRPVYIEKPVIEEVEKPVYVDRPVYIEKPVIREVEKPVRTVYIERSKRKLIIPKYNYLASSQTKRYHARTCRLGKLIKKKFKISSNSKAFFVRKKFKACKMCIKK